MSSLFDTYVRSRREHTPWATVGLLSFLKEMIWNGTGKPAENAFILRAEYRHDVASRIWYELQWTGEDNERYNVSSQDFTLLLWRAAQVEMETRRKGIDANKGRIWRVGVYGQRSDNDPSFEKRVKAHMAAVNMSSNGKIIEVYDRDTNDTIILVADGESFVQQGQ